MLYRYIFKVYTFCSKEGLKDTTSQDPKLFGIYHLLCSIGNSLGYNMYIEVFQFSKELPKYRGNCSTQECVEHNFKGMEKVFHPLISYIWVISSLFIFC